MSLPRVVRADASDAEALLHLMRELAEFEGYATGFKVTQDELITRGLSATNDAAAKCEFVAWIARPALGYAVVWEQTFTYTLAPTLWIKELWVQASERSTGLGRALMQAVVDHARARRCQRMRWDVLPDNVHAQGFYKALGGQPVQGWQAWEMILDS